MQAQVHVSFDAHGDLVIANEGRSAQRALRSSKGLGVLSMQTGKRAVRQSHAAGRWFLADDAGYLYEAGGYEPSTSRSKESIDVKDGSTGYQTGGSSDTGGEPDSDDEDVIVGDGYQTGGSSDTGGEPDSDDEDVIVGDGYQEMILFLQTEHGVVVEHDDELGMDIFSIPGAEDPIGTFFELITTVEFNGHLLVDYFRLLEIAAEGDFDEPEYTSDPPLGAAPTFPNDAYYLNLWNLWETGLAKAMWHPATAQRPVRLAVIDSGIKRTERNHAGLDGAKVSHKTGAPMRNPVSHALGIVSLLSDQSQDGSGVVGLLGGWNEEGCYGRTPLLAGTPPEVYSINVGDNSPSSIYVARAIHRAVKNGVDVINLSLRLAPSAVVEEAVQVALAEGVIVVAAAGNYPVGAGYRPTSFPANIEGVISVGAAGPDGLLQPFSANEGVDIAAPGVQVIVGGPHDTWYNASGTSFAAPHVAAAVAMMRSLQPNLTPAQAVAALQASAFNVDPAAGFLNAFEAVNLAAPTSEQVAWEDVPQPHECVGASAGSEGLYLAAQNQAAAAKGLRAGLAPPHDQEPVEGFGAYPNPFNPQTTLRFDLPEGQQVRLVIYNALGRKVRVLANGYLSAGSHELSFRARELPSGLYFARLETATGVSTHTLTLMK